MISIEYIKQMNKEAEERAKSIGNYPLIIKKKESIAYKKEFIIKRLRTIPFIGDWRPSGFKMKNTFLVDNSGLGADDEPAYTIEQFADKIKTGRAYAIIETGQFQVVIGEFEVN